MRAAAAAIVLVSVSVSATALAQQPEPDETFSPEDEASEVGLGVLGGAATLGDVAVCRGPQFDPAQPDPPLAAVAIRGELGESEADLRALLDAAIPINKKGRFWSEEACNAVSKLAFDLRYQLHLDEKLGDDGVTLGVELSPVTLVRHVDVANTNAFSAISRYLVDLFRWGEVEPIFRDELKRRLHLRPGSAIPDDPVRRAAFLDDEARRVREYLASRGYFDADCVITATPDGPHEVTVHIDIEKGRGYTVGKVAIKGNANVQSQQISEILQQKFCPFDIICIGHLRFSTERLKDDLGRVRELYQKLGYPGVQVRSNYEPGASPDRLSHTVRFEVTIEERKKIDVAFEGNREKVEDELRTYLTFNTANAYDDFEAEASAENIRHAYQNDGRFQAIVGYEWFRPENTNFARVLFHIDEGEESKVEGISFHGAKAFSEDRLKGTIATREHPSLALELFSSGGYVTSLQLRQDEDQLRELYRRNGYPAARAVASAANDPAVLGLVGAIAAQVTAGDPGHGLYLRYDIVEGPRELVAAVDFLGNNRDVTDEELGKVARLKPGGPYTPDVMRDDQEAILRHYREAGYLHAAVEAVRTGEGDQIKVAYHIQEGQLVHFGKVIVRGNFKTRGWVIKDALGFEEGELITLERLDTGLASLRRADLFSSVRPLTAVGSDPVHWIVEVEERYDYTADFEVGGGYSTDNSWFASFSLGMHNLFGVGVSAVASGEYGAERKRATLTFGFPVWLMKKVLPLGMRLDLSGRVRLDQTERFGELRTLGVSATLSRKIAEGVYFSLKYDWSRFGRSTEIVRPAGSNEANSADFVDTVTASLGPGIIVDRRGPTPLTPTHGYALSANVGVASRVLGGTDNFVKVGLSGQLLFSLGPRIVVTNTVRYDQGIPLGDTVLLPEVERFSAGGDATIVRGFEEDRLKTEIICDPLQPIPSAANCRVVPAGGNIRFIHNLDVQVIVWDKSWLFGLPIASAVFLDTAFVTNSFDKFSWSSVRQGIGIALARLVSPFGSFSLEYAFPLDPRLGDDPTGRLHFNFGFVF